MSSISSFDIISVVLPDHTIFFMYSSMCCWYCPSKHFLLLQTSSTSLQWNSFTSSIRLENIFEDVLKTCLEDVLETCLEDILKICLENVLNTLWRQTKYLLGLSVSNKLKCISNKYIFPKLYLTILRRIQNTLIRTHHFNICVLF